MKAFNPEKNKARLLKERLYKREYRKLTKDQPSIISDSVEERFSQRSSQTRSVRKAKKSFSRSPRKGNTAVSSLAKKFQLRILPQHSQSNRGRPKQDLDADEKSWLIDYLGRQDITYTTQVYMGKINGKKVYETKKYLLWSLNDLLGILNGCEVTGIQTEDSFMNEFERKLSFRQFYEFIKANKQHIYNKNILHATCLCEICKNAVFFMQGLNKSLPK